MKADFRGDADHHDGTSDATPGGYEDSRRPGEAGFAALLAIGSGVLLWNAYGISGFEALSGPGSVPMAVTAAMLVSALVILARTIRLPRVAGETLRKDVLPGVVIVMALALIGFGLLLVPFGFVPTAFLFLVLSIRFLSGRGWGFSLAVGAGSLVAIWLVFRLVFTVLLPSGILPEAELVQALRGLFAGGAE